ncbi:hypothetical protein [Paenibacillus sp. PL91]|uniref:hypothetical protein n=1 Tax=Paenibacillus sp. PL91 TaxID=2729538 RepID=UPI00145DC243|nr:hypothetical protein [Paenibacillus sp. PL91]MBC9204197.1 hypothetical protein [Paenibacillus sp. PL91]
MLLRDGISGFYNTEIDISLTDTSHFKKLCYALANHVGGKLLNVSEPQETNFYCADIQINGKEIHILLNGIYPLIAIASRVEYMNILFIDDQTISIGIEAYSTEYRVLQLRELSEQIQLDDRKNKLRNENTLNEKELKQIFYWKPKTVGEVIYNHWD